MEDLANQALLLFGNTLLAVLTVAAGAATKWIASKLTNERAKGIVLRTDDLAMKVVRDVYHSYMKPLRAKQGKLEAVDKAMAKEQAKEKLRSYLGTKGLKEVGWLISGSDSGGLDTFLGSVVENAVADSKALGGGAKTNPSPVILNDGAL